MEAAGRNRNLEQRLVQNCAQGIRQWRDLRLSFPGPLLRIVATLPFVISTGAKRSGEISVRMLFLGNAFRLSQVEERKCGHLAFEM